MRVVILVKKNGVRLRAQRSTLPPRLAADFFPGRAFAKEHDVSRDFGVGVFLEGGVRQTDCAKKIARLGHGLAQMGILFVERAPRRDERDQPAGPHALGRGYEVVVVNREFPRIELRIEGRVVAERHVGNREIEGIRRKRDVLERLRPDVRIGVERLGEPGGERVDFDTGQMRARRHRIRHHAKKVSESAGGLKDATVFETKTVQRRIHRPDDGGRSVMGVEDSGPRGTQFIGLKQSGQLLLLGSPLRGVRRRGEHLRQSAPADIFGDDGFFLRGGRPGLRLNLADRADRREVLAILLFQSTFADAVGVGDPVIARVERDYLARSGGRRMYFSLTSSHA